MTHFGPYACVQVVKKTMFLALTQNSRRCPSPGDRGSNGAGERQGITRNTALDCGKGEGTPGESDSGSVGVMGQWSPVRRVALPPF